MQTLIKNLLKEADSVFSKLEELSGNITELESQLNQKSIFFPFSYQIHKEEPSVEKPARDDHMQAIAIPLKGYITQIVWYLRWETVDAESQKAVKYRLYLVSEEHEKVTYCYEDPYSLSLSEFFKATILLRKPFIEHKLEVRISYGKYLDEFILALTKHLKNAQEKLDYDLPF